MKSFYEKLEKAFIAATFAEADCHNTAREIMEDANPASGTTLDEFLDAVGLGGVRYSYVVASL
jgi:hypothetical protein